MNAIKTKHNLDFESCEWPRDRSIQAFRIGTCEGQWFASELSFDILSVLNNSPGNGHLDDVFEWFEFACKRDGKMLVIHEFFNDRFKKHCVDKRGFMPISGTNDLIKIL